MNDDPQLQGDLIGRLGDRVTELRERAQAGLNAAPTHSRVPGGRFVHGLVGRAVQRQVGEVVEELNRTVDVLAAALEAQYLVILDTRAHLDMLLDRLAAEESAAPADEPASE